MSICALRGATGVSEDSPEAIVKSVRECFEALLAENHLSEADLACILFTITSDLQSKNPAGALRESGHGSCVPLFCMQEPEIKGMMPRCVRILLVLKEERSGLVPVYINGAERLRPDQFPGNGRTETKKMAQYRFLWDEAETQGMGV